MLSDLEIARSIPLDPLEDVAARYGIGPADLEPYGRTKAKIDHRLGERGEARARYVLVTAITPTPAGEEIQT